MSLNTRTVQAFAGRPANAWSAGYIGFLRSLLAVDLSILSSTRRSRIVFFFLMTFAYLSLKWFVSPSSDGLVKSALHKR